MLFFSISLLLAIFTILIFQKKFSFNKNETFYSFFPILFVYLGFISTLLSFKYLLTPFNFLILQILLTLITIKFAGKVIFKRSEFRGLSFIKLRKLFSVNGAIHLLIKATFVLLLVSSFHLRYSKPLTDYDDKAYRGSAPLYWIQNRSVSRFETIDERKNTLLYGSGLIYMWPVLFRTGEQFANIFYWLGFPLTALAIYIFSGQFSKSKELKLFSSLLFLGTPLAYQYYNSSLSQEIWLGLVLISAAYFLIKTFLLPKQNTVSSILIGLCFGVAIFIKTTAIVYLLLAIPLFIYRYKKNSVFINAAIGLLFSLFISGFIIILFQNNKIYGTVFGSRIFNSEYVISPVSDRALTQLKRIPFVLVEFPVWSKKIAEDFSRRFDIYSKTIGADKKLPEEDKEWIGAYSYTLNHPNKFFGIGGIWWLVSFIIAAFSLFKKGSSPKSAAVNLTYIFIFLTVSSIVVSIRWIETAGVPYRHLLSGYTLACCFSVFYIKKFHSGIRKLIPSTLTVIVIITSIQQLINFSGYTHVRPGRPVWQISQERNFILYDPYSIFLPYIRQQTSFLWVDSSDLNLPDYPFFWKNGQNTNKVYIFNFRYFLSDEVNTKALLLKLNKVQPEFLIVSTTGKSSRLTLDEKVLEKVTHIMTVDSPAYKTDIYQNKSKQLNKVIKI